MRSLLFVLLSAVLFSSSVFAAAPVDRFDPVEFEKRFNKADKAKQGKLSRAEAYAEFPRMPEFFDEIDRNKDNFITMREVNAAMERRVNAAISAGNPANRYGKVDAGSGASADVKTPAAQKLQFSSKEEARKYYRNEYFEDLAGVREKARARGEAAYSEVPPSPILKKEF